MPRAGRVPTRTRHNPLYQDIQEDSDSTPRAVKVKRRLRPVDLDEEEEEYLDPRSSRRVLELAQSQQEEFELDESDDDVLNAPRSAEFRQDSFRVARDAELNSEDEDEDPIYMNVNEEEGLLRSLDLDASDLAVLENLHPSDHAERKTLADIILSKMGAAEGVAFPAVSPTQTQKHDSSDPAAGLDPRIVELFTKAGQSMLSTGPLPKVIKLLPSFPSWQRYLALTQPTSWHPAALRKATGIFVANMKPRQAQFFFRYVLLPAVRDDIAGGGAGRKVGRGLNVHYYEALVRAMFKPAPFFKGVVFPFLEENCTLKEAAIVASVLAKKSIPSVHLGAAIVHIAASDFSGPRALFLRVLLDKKKDLPYRVLDDLVFHFIRISNWAKSKGVDLPVLWHQSLLVFSQRYSANLTRDQKHALLDVVKANFHHQIGPEVRRELAFADNGRANIEMIS
ncbi:Bystin [Hypsizygus marmoreus]|uniref:Bystin n=1 Tax=Hypsizygus marmoreus TaxID=39966 RepID=A0A369JYZ7_HYPMA|nr:Bystin [Hypsizygus marmoreus]